MFFSAFYVTQLNICGDGPVTPCCGSLMNLLHLNSEWFYFLNKIAFTWIDSVKWKPVPSVTPVRVQTVPTQITTEYDWKAPVREATLEQAAGANIDPVLLQQSIQEPPGDSDGLQCLIDQDLLELLPPAGGSGLDSLHNMQSWFIAQDNYSSFHCVSISCSVLSCDTVGSFGGCHMTRRLG